MFAWLQKCGNVADAEMFRVFNMGIGLCAVVAPGGVDELIRVANVHGHATTILGVARPDPEKRVRILPKRLEGKDHTFVRV